MRTYLRTALVLSGLVGALVSDGLAERSPAHAAGSHAPGAAARAGRPHSGSTRRSSVSDAAGATLVAARPNSKFSLRSVDSCFFAPPVAPDGQWPLYRFRRPHGIRGGLNEPRNPQDTHFGIDVAGYLDGQRVYAISPGRLRALRANHFDVWYHGNFYMYWHLRLRSSLHEGSVVRQGELLGRFRPGYYHVHIAEIHPGGCGIVDPRRPTGVFTDPVDTERPIIGAVHAYRSDANAFISFNLEQDPSGLVDPATGLDTADLSGVVDFRARVVDRPVRQIPRFVTLDQAPSAIRAFIAPVGRDDHHYRMWEVFDGAGHLETGPWVWHIFAFGTWRRNRCYFNPAGVCGMNMIWHVGGRRGFDTRTLPNGTYDFCMQALTIHHQRGKACTPIRIDNP